MSSVFADKLRIRVNGLLVDRNRLLLLLLDSPTRPKPFWTPPGGGLQFGERIEDALRREFLEETGLHVEPQRLMYVSEYVSPPWHAVEFYFLCTSEAGSLKTGTDPELGGHEQMIRDVRFFDFGELEKIELIPAFLRERFLQDFKNGGGSPVWIPQAEP